MQGDSEARAILCFATQGIPSKIGGQPVLHNGLETRRDDAYRDQSLFVTHIY